MISMTDTLLHRADEEVQTHVGGRRRGLVWGRGGAGGCQHSAGRWGFLNVIMIEVLDGWGIERP